MCCVIVREASGGFTPLLEDIKTCSWSLAGLHQDYNLARRKSVLLYISINIAIRFAFLTLSIPGDHFAPYVLLVIDVVSLYH
jgi:hypothetical protein